MLIYKDLKAKVVLPDRDTDYFKILPGAMQGNTLAPYLFCYRLRLCHEEGY